MGQHRDLRTPHEKFDDMLADDWEIEDIANRLDWTVGQCRARYHVVCMRLGVKPDADPIHDDTGERE